MTIPLDAITKIVGGSTGGASVALLVTYALFTPADDFARHLAENERGLILDLVGRAAAEEPGPYKDSLCRSLDEAIGRICAAAKDDAMCMDREFLREKAGCE